MPAVQSITDEILDLKRQRRAMIILAHHYQDTEIQDSNTSILLCVYFVQLHLLANPAPAMHHMPAVPPGTR